MNIKIVSNTMHQDLYEISKSFYSTMPYEKLSIKYPYGFDFLQYMIISPLFKNIDIMVYIDEDCFITNTDALQSLINYFVLNKLDCVGMPDGGCVDTRKHNPISINQFFCILNLKEIRKKYNPTIAVTNYYGSDLEKFMPKIKQQCKYQLDDFEPYYKIFFWMHRNNYKFQYLDAVEFAEDKITTILKNQENVEFAYHTWYARNWENTHQNRILKVIEYCKNHIRKEK